MGLDCFWVKKNEKGKEVMAPLNGLPEVWGSLSTDGKKFGFRGRIYEDLIHDDLTQGKYSLYGNKDGIIPTEDIRKISSILERTKYQNLLPLTQMDLNSIEYKNFVTMFAAHSKAGHYIRSWY